MRTRTHPLTLATLTALVGLSGPASAPTEYEASDYLPLAVGNSWTYGHDYPYGYPSAETFPAYEAARRETPPWSPQFTITVERTEVIDGRTYYVLSGMPSGGWPPAPPHFIAGKKLRWKGTRLMEHTGSGEQSFFRFEGQNLDGYTIPTTEGDNRVEVSVRASETYPRPKYTFSFHGYDGIPELIKDLVWPTHMARAVGFLAGYGPAGAVEVHYDDDVPVYTNDVRPVRAVLAKGSAGGASGTDGTVRAVTYEDARRGREGTITSSAAASWGEVKASGAGP